MLKLKIIKLRNISFGNMDIEILKAAKLTSKSTMLKGDHVTTDDESFKSLLKCLVKCHMEEETMQRRMNDVSSGS